MRVSLLPNIQSGMPATLARVKVPYVNYDNQSTILYSDDYMFLPAEEEVSGYSTVAPVAEGNALTQFAYYKNGGSIIKYFSGSASNWWFRSVYRKNSTDFCNMLYPSCVATGIGAPHNSGVAPCFCV